MGFGDAWFTCAGCRAIYDIRMLLPRKGARRPTGVAFEGRQVPRSTPIDHWSPYSLKEHQVQKLQITAACTVDSALKASRGRRGNTGSAPAAH